MRLSLGTREKSHESSRVSSDRRGRSGLVVAQGSARALGPLEPKRVGLIGTGWYGKCDLFRLIQVAPVEIVSLCDVDRKMLAEAAEIAASRQASKKKPRTYSDYRKMLAEKDLDIVLIATPDHWHALPMIAAVEAGADVYVQKPISVDVGKARPWLPRPASTNGWCRWEPSAGARPISIEARDRIIKEGKLGKIGFVETYCYYHMRGQGNPPDGPPPDYLDWDAGPAPLPCGPTIRMIHPRGWRSFKEYGNGILGDMCIHMLDMVRWMLDLGWPKRIASTGGILVQQEQQGQYPRHPDRHLRLRRSGRCLGAPHLGSGARSQVSLGRHHLWRQGNPQTECIQLRLHPVRGGTPIHRDVTYELRAVSRRTRPRRTWSGTLRRPSGGT